MNNLLFLFIFLELEILTTTGTGIGPWHYSPKPDREDGPRCHVWHQWFHVVPPYHMTCFQCQDVYSTIVYYGPVPLGAVYLKDCDSWRTRDAVSIMYPDVESAEDDVKEAPRPPLVHTVQYNILGGKCARIKYRKAMGGRWLPQPSRCDDITHWGSRRGKGFVNGWKTQPFSGQHGIVKTPLRVSKGLEENCHLVRTLPHRSMLYTMKCFDCKNPLLDGYISMVYIRGVPMAAASVGTCRTPVLEKSISIVQTGVHLEVGVQYLLGKDACVTKTYRMVNGGIVDGEDIKCSDGQQSVLSRREKLMATFGYVNGWKPKLDYDIIHLVDTPSRVTSSGTPPPPPPPIPPLLSPPQTQTVVLTEEYNFKPVDIHSAPNVAQPLPPPEKLPPAPLRTELVNVGEGVVEVAKMPGDGHCLFSTILHQLKLSNPGDSGHTDSVLELRKLVVSYVKAQLKESNVLWREQLVDSVEADPNRYPAVDENGNTIPIDKRIEAFLTNLEENEWGGTETIVAVSHLYNVVIVTYFESALDKHGKIVTYPEGKPGNEISIVYRLGVLGGRGSRIVRVHYDSFIRFVKQS